MAVDIEIIKCNAYVATVSGAIGGAIVLSKVNSYAAVEEDSGIAKITKSIAYAATIQGDGHVRLTKTLVYAALDGAVVVAAQVHPAFVNGNESQIFSPSLQFPKFTLKEMERNPYRPHLASSDSDIKDDFALQQRTLRDQHNITQGGDTTYDYGLLLKTYPKKQWTLGSLGRFFHDDYGLIMARFVQFKDCVSDSFQGQPVGRLKFNNNRGVNWVFTNNWEKSGSDLIGGCTFFAETPPDGYYGWMVVSGANPTNLRSENLAEARQDQTYTWVSQSTLGLGHAGRILGRKWGAQSGTGIPPGGLFITIEGPSVEELIQLLLDSIQADLANLQTVITQMAGVLTRVSTAETDIGALQLRDVQIVNQFTFITNALSNRITILQNQAAVDWQPAINLAVNALRDELNALILALQMAVVSAQNRADAAYALATVFPLGTLEGRLETIEASILSILDQLTLLLNFPSIYMPLVDGSIPPTFIQNPDGGLVYVRVE